MAIRDDDFGPPVPALLTFEEKESPLLLDVSSLLYDLELLHDLGVIVWYHEYSDFQFSRYFWYRTARPLKPEHRLRVRRIELKSPLAVEIIFGGAAAVWAFVQVAEKVSNWQLNRRKLRLEIEKLEAERNAKRYEEETARAQLEGAIREREAAEILSQILRRLEGNPIRLIELDIQSPQDR